MCLLEGGEDAGVYMLFGLRHCRVAKPAGPGARCKRQVYKPARLIAFRGDAMDAKDVILRGIKERALRRVGRLAGELARAASEDRELLLAGMEFERWLAENCQEAEAASRRP